MHYNNIESWKTAMKRIAKEKELDVQDVQQRYVLEEFAFKIGKSKYRDKLIIKGGFVVSTILGIDTRMTRDIDATYTSTIYDEKALREVLNEIINTKTNSLFEYTLESIKYAQKDDKYSGFQITIHASLDKTTIVIKLDISNNTLIYPDAIQLKLKSLFGEEDIEVLTYTLENIVAEKFETTLTRGEFNTRMRDLLDIYLLMKLNKELIEESVLKNTIIEVSRNRNSITKVYNYLEIIEELKTSNIFLSNLKKYCNFQYKDLKVDTNDVFETLLVIGKMLNE